MREPASYKDTVLLPVTDFPMKADLVQREPDRLRRWQEEDLYGQILAEHEGEPLFLLHDGPPFANGEAHMGTALNKTLKDLVVKSRTMSGRYAPYRPGWDCHGLPIEFKVVRESAGLEPAEIRRRCQDFARKWIEIQKTSFRRLGVLGEWDNPYLTMDAAYEADIVRFFATCVEKDLVYRDRRPVQWSYGARTALAEAEVEYKEKVSPAIFVKFPALTGPLAGTHSFVIWTTTPWTLPANLGIMVRAEYRYTAGDFTHEDGRTERLLALTSLLDSFTAKTGFTLVPGTDREYTGAELAGSTASHPFLPRDSKVITTLYVTNDTGTGQVHTAPGHGKEDYFAGMENGLGLLSPVADDGTFTEEAGMTGENGLPDLRGMLVFDANGPIIKLLAQRGMLIGKESYRHDYPHCWRSKTPVIFRSVEQFFLNIDKIRDKALEQIDQVDWLPAWGRNRIYGTAESRPDWCISRQRSWGVPLPVFMDEDGRPVLDAAIARKVADLVEEEGTNIWFELSDLELTERLGLPSGWKKGGDTLDVWIDSGCSSMAVTPKLPHTDGSGVADLYLEATDQHRGWFQSSLMCSVIERDRAPYRAVMTHGFVTDTSGEKISKSGDKPINVSHYIDKYGADIVRLWAAGVDWRDDVPFSDPLFKQNGEVYRRIRNTLRVLLGNLHDYDENAKAEFSVLDEWLLGRLNQTVKECVRAYDQYEFRKVFHTLNQFCTNDLSAIYIDVTKDRMYCDRADSPRRRSAQAVIRKTADALCRLLAPILAYTADEAWESLGHKRSVHLERFPEPTERADAEKCAREMDQMLRLRGVIQQGMEVARQEKRISGNLDAAVTLRLPKDDPGRAFLTDGGESLRDFVMAASLTLKEGPEPLAAVALSEWEKCPRCWRRTNDIVDVLCARCADALG